MYIKNTPFTSSFLGLGLASKRLNIKSALRNRKKEHSKTQPLDEDQFSDTEDGNIDAPIDELGQEDTYSPFKIIYAPCISQSGKDFSSRKRKKNFCGFTS